MYMDLDKCNPQVRLKKSPRKKFTENFTEILFLV